jgi:hypothetical protein
MMVVDGKQSSQKATMTVNQWFKQLLALRHVDVHCTSRLGKVLEDAGWKEVKKMRVSIPTGKWNGKLSEECYVNFTAMLSGLKGPLLQSGIIAESEEVDRLLQLLEAEVEQGKAYWNLEVYVARKPLDT